jgi:archaellum component FlaG (FlaF/FlaG flagellin family)
MDRRKFLKAASGTAVLGLTAGCLGGEEDQATETADPDETTTEAGTATETEGTSTADNETTDEGTTDEGTTTEDGAEDVQGEVGETPSALSVTDRELYRTDGEVGLRATVENTGEQAYEHVEAEVTLQDDQGEILYEFVDETEDEEIDSLASGDTWQFDVVFQKAQMGEVRTYTVDLEGDLADQADAFDDVVDEVDQQDPNLEITSHNLTREESTTFVSGTVKNVGGETIESVEVSVTLYDDGNNELLDLNDTVEEEGDVAKLPPGQVWDFRVTFQDVDMQNVARYVISADSDIV